MKKSCLLNSFNLFSEDTGHKRKHFSHSKTNSKQNKKVVELYFINPNILFMDNQRSDKILRTRTAGTLNRRTTAEERIKTCNSGQRHFNETAMKFLPTNRKQIETRERRLDEYIKMERVFLKFRKTGEVRSGSSIQYL